MTDEEFARSMQLIAKKDKSGLHRIYEEYGLWIYRTFFSAVRSRQDAEDLTSDFFLKLWQKPEGFRAGSGHRAYLAAIAHNMAVDLLRSRGRLASLQEPPEAADDAPDPSRVDEDVEGGMLFRKALDTLPPAESEIIGLHIGMELTFREISEALKIPLGTVTWRYQNAIKKLRQAMEGGALG